MNKTILVVFIFLTLLSVTAGILGGISYQEKVRVADVDEMQEKIDSLYEIINEPTPVQEPMVRYLTNNSNDWKISYLEDKLNRTELLISDMNETIDYWHDKYKRKKKSSNPSPLPGY